MRQVQTPNTETDIRPGIYTAEILACEAASIRWTVRILTGPEKGRVIRKTVPILLPTLLDRLTDHPFADGFVGEQMRVEVR